MIIKSMGRRKSTSKTGQHLLKTLFDYLLHEHDTPEAKTNAKIDLEHNIPSGLSHEEILDLFIDNARLLHERKGGNTGYHEIISLPANDMDREQVKKILRDIGKIYLDARAPENLALGMVHTDREHVHLHIMLSSNRLYDRKRLRLSKDEFLKIQQQVVEQIKTKYAHLNIENLYSAEHIQNNSTEQVRTSRGEQEEQKRHHRSGNTHTKHSQKINMASQLHSLFEQYRTSQDLTAALENLGYKLYQRGKNFGIVDQQGKKHRFSTLGLTPHFEIWQKNQIDGSKIINSQAEPKNSSSKLSLDEELDKRIEELKKARAQGKQRDNEAER